jgi:hypothetical protein
MKKTLLITLLGALSASQLMAVDLFVTGSTAFRTQVYNACSKLYSGTPTITYDTTGAIGGDGTSSSSNPVWTMTGTASSSVSALSSGTLVIHGNFTGSVQGCETVENKVGIVFLTAPGTPTYTYMTNTPTIAFSDVSSLSTPYPAKGSWSEEQVAVQPFVFVKSASTDPRMNSVTNITWEEIKSMHTLGNLPLSEWTGNPNDYNTNVYILNRTKDSGTRRTTFAYVNDAFSATINTYNYDQTNHVFYDPTGDALGARGESAYAVIGSFAGFNNANLQWGPGYIAGGDIKNALGVTDSQNLSIGYLSLSDAKAILSGTANQWSQVISLNGAWPTAAGLGIHGNNGTNDFTPICAGFYGLWSYEVVVYPNVNPSSLSSDQNLTAAQLGNQTTTGTILGVLDKVNTQTPISGSLDFEIQSSKTGSPGATAIRLLDMVSSRTAVGGPIAP